MQKISFLNKNILSPRKEMLAYETLWAIEDSIENIKEKDLRELFYQYTPIESLKELSSQANFYEQEYDKIQNEVIQFFKTNFSDQIKTFSIVVNRSIQYPDSLKTGYPIGLFYYKGNLDTLDTKRCVSIVGTRKASQEGIAKTKEISGELVKQGFTIVSGLAKGIDTIAHQSAIDNGGNTIGVIGTPINEYYSKENKDLQDRIAKDFLLISHVPFYKYAKESFNHHRFHFPRRNLTMASISEATIIIEASDTSGSLIQADKCCKLGKKLFILDSCFKNPEIKWPDKYEKKGAIRVKNSSEILNYL